MNPMNMHPTTAAVGSSASGVIILEWALKTFLHVELPAEVAVALVGVFGGIVGSLMRRLSQDIGVPLAPPPAADPAKA